MRERTRTFVQIVVVIPLINIMILTFMSYKMAVDNGLKEMLIFAIVFFLSFGIAIGVMFLCMYLNVLVPFIMLIFTYLIAASFCVYLLKRF